MKVIVFRILLGILITLSICIVIASFLRYPTVQLPADEIVKHMRNGVKKQREREDRDAGNDISRYFDNGNNDVALGDDMKPSFCPASRGQKSSLTIANTCPEFFQQ